MYFEHSFFRDSFWRNVGITNKTDKRKRKFVHNYFTGIKEPFTNEENEEMATLLRSAPFQEEFCNYLLHTSTEKFMIFIFDIFHFRDIQEI